MRHYDKKKFKHLRSFIETRNTWKLKYRLVEFKYFNTIKREMDSVYWVQARLWWLPIWITIDECGYFGTAYREMQSLRTMPKSETHIYTEDECVLELMGESEND